MLNISRENLVFLLRVKFRSSSESFKLTDRFRLKVEPVLFPNECKIKCRVLIPCRMESEVIRVDLLHLLRHMSRSHVSCLMSHVSCLMFQCWWMSFCCLSYRRRRRSASWWESQQSAECHILKKRWRHHISFHRDNLLFVWITTENLLALTLRAFEGNQVQSVCFLCSLFVPSWFRLLLFMWNHTMLLSTFTWPQ